MAISQTHIDWAKAYPFDVPKGSYVYVDGKSHPISEYHEDPEQWTVSKAHDEHLLRRVLTTEQRKDLELPRIAVLACGSNASPTRLTQKYQELIPDAVIPVVRCTLMEHAIVHAANLTAYGSVPATFARAAGARVETFVTLLSAEQLAVMDETETLGISYDRLQIPSSDVNSESTLSNCDAFHAYISLHGALLFGDEPSSLATINGHGVPFSNASQENAQEHASQSLDHAGSVDQFIRENLENKPLRLQRAKRLKYEFSQAW